MKAPSSVLKQGPS